MKHINMITPVTTDSTPEKQNSFKHHQMETEGNNGEEKFTVQFCMLYECLRKWSRQKVGDESFLTS